MSKVPDTDTDDDTGCLFFFGVIIIGIAVGHLTSAAWGWLFVGIIFVSCAIAMASRK